jgi:hypothetical protein
MLAAGREFDDRVGFNFVQVCHSSPTLDIPVNFSSAVQIFQSLEYVPKNDGDVFL